MSRWRHVSIEPYPTIAIEGPRVDENGKEWWTTTKGYAVDFDPWMTGILEIRAGFEHDGASVPRAFWRLFPKLSIYALAALVHDYLYAHRGRVELATRTGNAVYWFTFNRKQADLIFLHLMEFVGVPWWKRSIMYRAVRIGGPRW